MGSLRATCAFTLVLASAACSFSTGPSDEDRGAPASDREAPAALPTTSPVRDVAAQPSADFGTVDGEDGRVAVGWDAPETDVGFLFAVDARPGPAVLVFQPILTPAACITAARLDLTMSGTPGPPLAVYPGDPTAVPASDGDAVPSWSTLLDNRPRGIVVDVDGTAATADVTELVRTWAAGGPFASRNRTVDPGGPLVLVVQPETATSRATVRLSMSESGPSTAPVLTVAAAC